VFVRSGVALDAFALLWRVVIAQHLAGLRVSATLHQWHRYGPAAWGEDQAPEEGVGSW